jgi:hypothetical protein
MALQSHREKVLFLRKKGESINEITQSLRLSKSTVSYWCRDISLSKQQLKTLAKKQLRGGMLGRLRAAEQKRTRRIEQTNLDMSHGARDVNTLSERDVFILGIALYWGEGYKSGNEECGLTNSDPAIIIAFITWLKCVYKINNEDLILRVSLNETHRHRAIVVEKHWSKITNVPLYQFTKTSFIKAKTQKKYKNSDQHFGTLRVKVRRGTSLRRRIIGSINALKKHFLLKPDQINLNS